MYAVFLLPDGRETTVLFRQVNWKEWFLCHYHFDEKSQKVLHVPGVCFNGFRIMGGTNTEDRILYFDNFSLWKEEMKPLVFKPRPKRGIDMFPGQPVGLNTGPGRLPFPTREETILPDSHGMNAKNYLTKTANTFTFRYEGDDGSLTIRYQPESGTWSDLTAQWNQTKPFHPTFNGGINWLLNDKGEQEKIDSRKLLSVRQNGNRVETVWECVSKTATTKVEYHLQMMDKSLLVDTFAKGGKVPTVSFGSVSGIENPRAIAVPYFTYAYNGSNRPYVALFEPKGSKQPLFLQAMPDWYRSNASTLSGGGRVEENEIVSNLNAGYEPKTDGQRNDVYERFFITISPKFAEVLPSIANPASPWRHLGGKKIWHSHGASSNRENDYRLWKNRWRYGIREMLVTDHEVGWRDGGESFTFRTKPAPKKGGDKGQFDYTRFLQDELGYIYGPYNNYMDFASVNEYWNTDMIVRLPNQQLHPAWARCYAPKPSFSVEYCEKLVPIIQEKFHFTAGYCDVHTAVPPWARPDYDARVPGAGTFAASYYAWGEIMLLQKKGFQGPVYSEGPMGYLYSGLTDGNYAQDQGYVIKDNPWLVDFDLLKMHDLECNFGMGKIYMFEPRIRGQRKKILPEEQNAFLDRYLAATLAFGHTGYLVTDFGLTGTLRSYYMIQAIAARYTQAAVESISYVDEKGTLLNTDQAITGGALVNNQLVVRYKDGTLVVVNGNETRYMKFSDSGTKNVAAKTIILPPNGYYARTADGKILVESSLNAGGRYDYSVSFDYIFFDGRGTWQSLEKAGGTGQGICRNLSDGTFEVIYSRGTEIGFKLDANEAVALNEAGKELGPAKLKKARGYLFVEPVKNAFSYILRKNKGQRDNASLSDGTGRQLYVTPGMRVTIYNNNDSSRTSSAVIPANAPVGKTLWLDTGDKSARIPFFVVPPIEYATRLLDNRYLLVMANNVPDPDRPVSVEVQLDGKKLSPSKDMGKENTEQTNPHFSNQFLFDLGEPSKADQEKIEMRFRTSAGKSSAKAVISVTDQPICWERGLVPEESKNAITPAYWMQCRGKEPTQEFAATGAGIHYSRSMLSGGTPRTGYFIHPPYLKGTGRAWLEYDLKVPQLADGTAVFRSWVGKKDGSTPGDGIVFQVAVLTPDANGKEKIIAEQLVDGHFWRPIEADLTPYIGQRIRLRLISDVGPKNNSIADQSHWGTPRIEGRNMFRERKM